ncbi:hypothetical protein B0J15DRAFT_578672 [Fusarium solani]|uniref:Uncharacterized protein n=1 Tax=Fusarium solani TaxID=169388 RepID=A0A9P9KU08_FUSSL|nr:uncharacterized protein B0J15DRAFT_578672 [Fusarium solani]KAH7268514.1 hypothetical protein B0J15DRAFT_578672 [Fusarium solani]
MSTIDAAAPTASAPRGETSLSNREIVEALGEFWPDEYTEKKLTRGARRISNATRTWPWELLAGCAPRVWSFLLTEELADTIERLGKELTNSFIEFLQEQVRQLQQNNPQLNQFDIIGARREFGAKARDRATGKMGRQGGEKQKTYFSSLATTESRKRTHEPPDDSHTNKSARRDRPDNAGGGVLGSPAGTTTAAEGFIDSVNMIWFPAMV